MIYQNSTVTVTKGESKIDSPIILYRGDREIEINFTIKGSPFRYRNSDTINLIEQTDADYAQLIIKVPNDRDPIFSEITETKKGSVILTITAEMIDEIEELGKYDFQIRLFDSDKTSRATIPPVADGIEIREPIAIEDEIVSTSNEVNVAQANYALTTAATTLEVFDEDGNYIETTWVSGDRITDANLNKIEDGITGVNQKVANAITSIPTKTSDLTNDSEFITTSDIPNIPSTASNISITDTAGNFTSENVEGALQEIGSQIKEIVNNGPGESKIGNLADITETDNNSTVVLILKDLYARIEKANSIINKLVRGEDIYEPFYEGDIPIVSFTGDVTNMSKENAKILQFSYESQSKILSCYAEVKWQGSSSLSYDKKNYTVKLYDDENNTNKVDFNMKNWGKQNKFCFKANWIDSTHSRNIVGARLGASIIGDNSALPVDTPNGGLIDGVPIKLIVNGESLGLYTWNIPKDGWMFGMTKKDGTQAVLCSESVSDTGCFIALPDYTTWSDEFPGTENGKIMSKFQNAVSFIMNSSDEEFAARFEQYFNLEATINYYLFGLFVCHLDGFGKNQLMLTYDSGETWYPSLYDLDSTFGLYWNGATIVSPEYRMFEDYEIYNTDRDTNGKYNLLYKRLLKCFPKEIYDRYTLLRQNQFALPYVEKLITDFHDAIPTELFEEDLSIWPEQPSKAYDYTQMIEYMTNRAQYSDSQIELLNNTWSEIQTITISAESTSLEVGNTLKLNHTISPYNSSNKKVVWSVSDNTLASIDQKGNFIALANGIVTVSCTSVENESIIGTYDITVVDARLDSEKIITDGLVVSWDFNNIDNYRYYNDGTVESQYFSICPTYGDASQELISATTSNETRALSTVIPHMVSASDGFNGTILDGSGIVTYNASDFENTTLDASTTSDNTYSIELVVKLTQKPISGYLAFVNSCGFRFSTDSKFVLGDRNSWIEPSLVQSEALSSINVGDIMTFTIVSSPDNVKIAINGNIVVDDNSTSRDWSSLSQTSIEIPISPTYYKLMNAKLYNKCLNSNELLDNTTYNNAVFNITQ